MYSSLVTKAKVDVTDGLQFGRRTWTAPENLPNNKNYRVVVAIKWYQRGGSTHVQGTVRASYGYYHVKGGGVTSPPYIRTTDCYVNN